MELGYTGSREEFLASAMGPQGPAGPAGPAGKDGTNGIDGINGKDGKDGRDGIDGINGKDGKDGTNGIDGINGKDGKDGRDGIDGKDGKGADLGAISHLDIKNQSMDEITMTFDGGSGSQPQSGDYIPPHLTMKKGTNEVKVVIPNNLSGNYILTLPQESGTLLTAGNLTIDNLNSTLTDKALSANQGRILKTFIDNINTLLSSDDTTLDSLQEIVNFIKINKETLNSLTISSISGLGDALASKLDKNQNAVSASKLATVRTIGGVSFDGTSDINPQPCTLPFVRKFLITRAWTTWQSISRCFDSTLVILLILVVVLLPPDWFLVRLVESLFLTLHRPCYRDWETDRKSTRLNSSHITRSRMPSSA